MLSVDSCQTPRAQRVCSLQPSSPLMPKSHVVSTVSVALPKDIWEPPRTPQSRGGSSGHCPLSPRCPQAFPVATPRSQEGGDPNQLLPPPQTLSLPWWFLESAARLVENVDWWLLLPAPGSPSWPGLCSHSDARSSDLSQMRVSPQKNSASASTGRKLALAFVSLV